MMHTSGGGCLLIVLVVLAEARPGRFPGWLIGCFRCFTLLPSGERSSPLGASADVQVFSVVFTFGACSSSILGAHHTGDRGGARTLDPCVSSFVLIPRVFFLPRRALVTAAIGASPIYGIIGMLNVAFCDLSLFHHIR